MLGLKSCQLFPYHRQSIGVSSNTPIVDQCFGTHYISALENTSCVNFALPYLGSLFEVLSCGGFEIQLGFVSPYFELCLDRCCVLRY